MKVQFVRKSAAPVRAVPVRAGMPAPRAERAAVAGFTGAVAQAVELVGRKRRLLLVGAGDGRDPEAWGALAVARLPMAEHIALDARLLTPAEAGLFAAGACMRGWQFDRLRTRPDPARARLRRIDVLVPDPAAAAVLWAPLHAAIQGAEFARDLVAEPGNILTPQGFLTRLTRLERVGVTVEALGPEQLRQEGLGALLAVGGASQHPPALAVLRWRGTTDGPPVAFVGKGITFDTGGVSIKPAAGMWDMRADMAGAAACAGAMLALALRRAPTPAVAVLALAENAVGGAGYRPSDVIRTYDGTTVEVVDTDAEGRMALADALGWTVTNLRPRAVVDLATLTGSIVVALGHERAGLFASDDRLADALLAAGDAVGEPVWRMPIGASHEEALESDIADFRQCSPAPKQPDACIAAAFLRHFVRDVPWAHLDIAGVEQRERGDDRHAPGATGFGVRLLDRLVADWG